jgi:hypothetical protein
MSNWKKRRKKEQLKEARRTGRIEEFQKTKSSKLFTGEEGLIESTEIKNPPKLEQKQIIVDKPGIPVHKQRIREDENVRVYYGVPSFSGKTSVTKNTEVKNIDSLKQIPEIFGPYIFHMTHIANLENILKQGLLTHGNKFQKVDISNLCVNEHRCKKESVYGKSVHDYVPFYFNIRNAMLYPVQYKYRESIVVLAFNRQLMLENGTIFTNQNAATSKVEFTNDINVLASGSFLDWNQVTSQKWSFKKVVNKDIRGAMMAEVLVFNKVEANKISWIYCQTDKQVGEVRARLKKSSFGEKISKYEDVFFDLGNNEASEADIEEFFALIDLENDNRQKR